MDRTIHYNINEDYPTIRHFLTSRRYPRAVLIQLKKNESQVILNGAAVPLWKPLHIFDILEITIREEKGGSLQIVPVETELKVVYEDEDILVIDKPSGMSIHPSFKHYEDSLANAVMGYYKKKNDSIVFRCINRLDKETSGLTIIAKNMLAAAILGVDVKYRRIHREYRAVVKGRLPLDNIWHKIDAPIDRMPGTALMRHVDHETGKEAVTWYNILNNTEKYSLLQLKLDTGRTPQIRVHMKYIGYPLPGDYLYEPDYEDIKRVPLHSYRLEFTHPVTGERIELTSPVPEDMNRMLMRA